MVPTAGQATGWAWVMVSSSKMFLEFGGVTPLWLLFGVFPECVAKGSRL